MTSPESNIHELKVIVSRKPGVPNPEVSAMTKALHDLGFGSAEVLSVGQTIKLEIDAENLEAAAEVAKGASEKLLANPVIQQFEIFGKNGERIELSEPQENQTQI